MSDEPRQQNDHTRYFRRLPYRIGIVCDRFLYDSIRDAAHFVYLGPDDWQDRLETERIDALLFVSTWEGLHDDWIGASYPSSEIGAKAIGLINECRRRGIPTIFYSKEDPPSYFGFLEYAKLCDYIFTSCEECIPYYKEDCRTDQVRSVLFGINPALHNPIGSHCTETKEEKAVLFSGTWMDKFPKRCREMSVLFDGILASDHSLTIIDRYYGKDKFTYPEKYQAYTKPAVDHGELLQIHKRFDWAMNINTITDSGTMFANRTFELLASGVALLSNYSVGVNSLLPCIFLAHDPEEIPLILNGFTGEELYSHQMMGVRSVMTGHTCFDRIAEILRPLGFDCAQPKRRVLVIGDEGDLRIRASFERQTFGEKAIAARDDVDEALLSQYDMVTWFDPEAQYGPFYLEDMVNGFKYTASDYITKDAWVEGGVLHEGKEHSYVSHMSSPYRTVFWRDCYPASFFLSPPPEQDLENGYSIDHFSYDRRPAPARQAASEEAPQRQYLLSMVIPVCDNGPQLYGKCFASLRRSSMFEDMEILLVDDGSTDENTLRMEEYLMDLYPNIRLYRFDGGRSGSASRPRNKGVELATAEYIAFLDPDDDAVRDGYAVLCRRAMEENLDLAFGNAYQTGLPLRDYYRSFSSYLGNDFFTDGISLAALKLIAIRLHVMVIRRDLLLDNDLQQVVGAFGEDTLFSWQVLESARRIRVIDLPIQVYYAQTAGSVTNAVRPSYFEKLLLLQEEKSGWLIEKELMEAYMSYAHNSYIVKWVFQKLSLAEEPEECCRLVEEILGYYDAYYRKTSPEINAFLNLCRRGQYAEASEMVRKRVPKKRARHPAHMVEVFRPEQRVSFTRRCLRYGVGLLRRIYRKSRRVLSRD